MAPKETEEPLAQFDLTAKLMPYMDRHLLFPMLHFLKELGIHKKEDLLRAEIELLQTTYMLDFQEEKYQELGESVPDALNERREEVMALVSESREMMMKLLEILEDEAAVKKMHNLKTIADVCSEFDVTPEQVEGLASFAKVMFECGGYQVSGQALKHYRHFIDKEPERTLTSKLVSCNWGSAASFLLNRDYEAAADVIEKLNEFLETAKMHKREVLLQRTWLLHWSLFAIFQSDSPPEKVLNIFLDMKSLSVISISCPHLFRYVSACLILNKRLKLALKETVWIVQLESTSYSDPVTRFLVALYTDLDFDGAQRELQACANLCKADFFLAHHWSEFEENARLLIFEQYCRIHQCINIDMIATRLNMSPAEAELWIVKLIQNAKLDARIDSEKSRVVMSKAPPSVYQQVLEKTKNLSFRSTMLLSNLEKRENERKGIV